MKNVLNKKIIISGVVAVLCGAGLVWVVIVEKSQALVQDIGTEVSSVHEEVLDLIRSFRTDTTNPVIATLVQDCTNAQRSRFDSLLGKLSQPDPLLSQELIELNQLYNECAYFYADRRRLTALQLKERITILTKLLALEDVYARSSLSGPYIQTITQLAEEEARIASMFHQLAQQQGNIITELVAGNTNTTPAIQAIRDRVVRLQADMNVSLVRTEGLRRELEIQ